MRPDPASVLSKPPPTIVPALQLFKSFKPIESIVDGLPIPRGGITALTASTGHGKTTLSALLQVSLCRGLAVAGREVMTGSVLVLAGENPDDYTAHLIGTAQDHGLVDGADLSRPPPLGQLLVIPGTFDIDYEGDYLKSQIQSDLVAVFVDTSAAYYTGQDDNGNVDQRRHASMLRSLTDLPGNPAVIVLCHPVKNATRDNLIPRGGGAFLNEVDGNLTLWKDESNIATLHWQGKIRGPQFDPIQFEIVPNVELTGYTDSRGKAPITSVARYVPPERAEQLHQKAVTDADRLLVALQKHPGASVRDLAMKCGFVTSSLKPHTSRLDRAARGLQGYGLVDQDRKGKWMLTPKGQKEAERL